MRARRRADHTDAIDNSAGVDCSDHEVNIKILLGDVVAAGEMTLKQRNNLLDEMTDEVAELVLDNNRAQTLALMVARAQSLPMVNVHARASTPSAKAGSTADSSSSPSDKQIAERQSTGSGLTTPEFAVLIAYTKNANVAEILTSDLPEIRPRRGPVRLLPVPLRERFQAYILRHRLRREIATTKLVNQMANLSGISYDHRMTEDTGASITDVSRAWLAVREVLDFPVWWDRSVTSPTSPSTTSSTSTSTAGAPPSAARSGSSATAARRSTSRSRWSAGEPLRRSPPASSTACVARCATRRRRDDRDGSRRACQKGLAARSAVWRLLHTTFDVISSPNGSASRRRTRAPAAGGCSTGSS